MVVVATAGYINAQREAQKSAVIDAGKLLLKKDGKIDESFFSDGLLPNES